MPPVNNLFIWHNNILEGDLRLSCLVGKGGTDTSAWRCCASSVEERIL
jgi:hypothetical protein